MITPGPKNDFAKRAKKMKYPAQLDNVDYGKKSKVVPRTVDMIDSKTGKFYGSKTIMTKESSEPKWKVTYDYYGSNREVPLYTKTITIHAQTADEAIAEVKRLVGGRNHKAEQITESITTPSFIEYLIESDKDDITALPDRVISELKSNIRKGASDLAQAWKNALELTNTAYFVSNVRLPKPDQKGAWKQYMELISHAVKQLSAARGIDGKWRVDGSVIREAAQQPEKPKPIGKHRFFVRVPGEVAQEVDAESMDDVIDKLTSRIHVGQEVRGTKVRVMFRNETSAKLGIYLDGALRDTVLIQDIS